MNIVDLPIEIQNNIFYFYAEHPCAKMLKEAMNNYFIDYQKIWYHYINSDTAGEVLYETFREFFSETHLDNVSDRRRESEINRSEISEIDV